jgi:hypothetical protein
MDCNVEQIYGDTVVRECVMSQEVETIKKRQYVAPTLRSIELITEEVLADNCKVSGLLPCDDPAPTLSYGS